MQKNLSKEVKNQIAEKCFIYNLHYDYLTYCGFCIII